MVLAYGSRQEGDYWVTKTSTLLKTIMLKFKLEEEFDDLTPDGRHVSSFSKLNYLQTWRRLVYLNCSSLFDARRHDLGERQTSKMNFAYFAHNLVNGFSLFIRNLHPQVKSMVTFEDGKIVTVQTAIKEGQKSTR